MEYRGERPSRRVGPGALRRWENRLHLRDDQLSPSGPSGHGIDPDYRGLDRYTPARDAGAAAHYYRSGLRLFLASERVEVVEDL